jgi:hypothetical protein
MSDQLLSIINKHIKESGDPPFTNNDDENIYIGYFENPYGEQWVFTYNRQTKNAVLRGGDVGWAAQFNLVDGAATGLVLGQAESLWLAACWYAVTGKHLQ